MGTAGLIFYQAQERRPVVKLAVSPETVAGPGALVGVGAPGQTGRLSIHHGHAAGEDVVIGQFAVEIFVDRHD